MLEIAVGLFFVIGERLAFLDAGIGRDPERLKFGERFVRPDAEIVPTQPAFLCDPKFQPRRRPFAGRIHFLLV